MNNFPLVVDRTRTKRVSGEKTSVQETSIEADMEKQGLADIRKMMQLIVEQDVAQQERIGNPFNRLIVDSQEQSLAKIDKKAEVLFGNFLERAAMRAVETELTRQFNRVSIFSLARLKTPNGNWETVKRPTMSTSEWEWVYYERKGATGKPIRSGVQMPAGAVMVFRPRSKNAVELASWMNHVYKQEMFNVERISKRQRERGRIAGGLGFMAATSASLRRKSVFKAFTVRAGYSNARRGTETWKYGTPYISIVAKARGRRRR